jgi:hypothetical protein
MAQARDKETHWKHEVFSKKDSPPWLLLLLGVLMLNDRQQLVQRYGGDINCGGGGGGVFPHCRSGGMVLPSILCCTNREEGHPIL